jgi:hypothetical protein
MNSKKLIQVEKNITSVLVTSIALILAGCANPGVVQLSPDTYFISHTDHSGIFGNASRMKAEVIQKANQFAARQGKIAIPISTHETPMGIGQFASFDYQFRVVSTNDPEAVRTSLVPRPDIVVEQNEKVSADVHTSNENNKEQDLYTELIKLHDLRKKGIITDAEFQAQKQKLLNEKN